MGAYCIKEGAQQWTAQGGTQLSPCERGRDRPSAQGEEAGERQPRARRQGSIGPGEEGEGQRQAVEIRAGSERAKSYTPPRRWPAPSCPSGRS